MIVQVIFAVVVVAISVHVGLAHAPHDVVTGVTSSTDGNVIAAIIRLEFCRSSNGGYSWTCPGCPELGAGGHGVTGISPVDPDESEMRVYSFGAPRGKPRAVYVSTSLRQPDVSWTPVGENMNGVAQDFGNTRKVLVISTRSRNDAGMLYYSKDYGKTMKKANSMPHVSTIMTVQGSFNKELLGAGSSSGDVLLSTDGNVWATLFKHPESSAVTAMAFGEGNDLFIGFKDYSIVWFPDVMSPNTHQTLPMLVTTAEIQADIDDQVPLGITALGVLDGKTLLATSSGKDVRLDYLTKRKKWSAEWKSLGLVIEGQERMPEYQEASFSDLVTRKDGVAMVGSFWGVFATKNSGKQWFKLDSISSDITDFSVSATTEGYRVSACTYNHFCWLGTFEPSKPRKFQMTLNQPQRDPHCKTQDNVCEVVGGSVGYQRYNLQKLSPDYVNDQLVIRCTPLWFPGVVEFSHGQDVSKSSAHGVVFRSTDGGKTWSSGFKVLGYCHDISFSAGYTIDDGEVYVAGYNFGIMKSVDGGLTFKDFYVPPRGLTHVSALSKITTGKDPNHRDYLLARFREDSDDDNVLRAGFAPHLSETVFLSTNRGKSFKELRADVEECVVGLAIISNTSPPTIVSVSEYAIFWSSDLGETWNELDESVCDGDAKIVPRRGRRGARYGRSAVTTFEEQRGFVAGFREGAGLRVFFDAKGQFDTCSVTTNRLKDKSAFKISQTHQPPSTHLRGLGSLVSTAPQKQVAGNDLIFAAHDSAILVSNDMGTSFQVITHLPADNDPPSCAVRGKFHTDGKGILGMGRFGNNQSCGEPYPFP